VNFDTATKQVKWSAAASGTDIFVGSPAIAGTTVYVQNSGRTQLEARRESDGQILWTWKPTWKNESAFQGNVVVTQNLVFVSTTNHVYAIDTATHQSVWMYPYAGMLAISANGVLYVRRGTASLGLGLAAINLQ
jgi:outer membrane protein assembly factor BamB